MEMKDWEIRDPIQRALYLKQCPRVEIKAPKFNWEQYAQQAMERYKRLAGLYQTPQGQRAYIGRMILGECVRKEKEIKK